MVSPDERQALAFIPGISMPAQGMPHAFIQVLDGKRCKAEYFRFPVEDFRPDEKGFELWLGNNFFSAKKIQLDLPGYTGQIELESTVAWPKMLGAPGIMGWYSFVPFMECNHGVVSLDHGLRGSLVLGEGGERVDFSGGKGYLEKDWGSSFPRAYVWMQTNHFDAPASLIASAAHIPWLGSHFIGFISGFWLEGRLFRFATYTGAKMHLDIGEETVSLVFRNPSSEIRILAHKGPHSTLISPVAGEMTGKINESMQATIQVELLERGQRIFEGTGRNAGLEVAGHI